ncbi:MAG TPA: hypothetical protein VGF18_05410 [Candidatus Tumulicola sp.]
MARKTSALASLLERRREVEQRCLHAWVPLERERARGAAELERLEAVARQPCGDPATTGWWQMQTARAIRATRERLERAQKDCEHAAAAVSEAKRGRRVLEKLEERFARAERERRARAQTRDDDEANTLARGAGKTRVL